MSGTNSSNRHWNLNSAQIELLQQLETNVEVGLSRDAAAAKRRFRGGTVVGASGDASAAAAASAASAGEYERDGNYYNVIDPPISCPAWVCCLLPCIDTMFPSRKEFKKLEPDDAEVLRESKWIRYDAISLVCGDIIQIHEGDVIPADCVLLKLQKGGSDKEDQNQEKELIVDLRSITGEDTVRSITEVTPNDTTLVHVFRGGRVLQGSALAVVVAIGSQTLLASLIQEGKFPPKQQQHWISTSNGRNIEMDMELPLVMTRKPS
jgi:hypothetical protein